MTEDPYKVLGVSPDATDDEIKKAYRTLAKKYHPDLHPGDKETEQKMKEVNEAYDAIKNRRSGSYDGGYSSYGGYSSGRGSGYSSTRYSAACSYINNGRFREALNCLDSISDRTAEWYYLSALANMGLGNRIAALENAKTAVNMDPANDEYVRLADFLEYGGVQNNFYAERSAEYPGVNADMSRMCMGLCLGNLCLRLFCCC